MFVIDRGRIVIEREKEKKGGFFLSKRNRAQAKKHVKWSKFVAFRSWGLIQPQMGIFVFDQNSSKENTHLELAINDYSFLHHF